MFLFCFIIPVLQSNRGKVIWLSKGCSCRRVFDVRLNLVDDCGSHLLWHLLFLGKEKKKRAFVATRMVIMMEVGVITDESHPKSRLIILSLSLVILSRRQEPLVRFTAEKWVWEF